MKLKNYSLFGFLVLIVMHTVAQDLPKFIDISEDQSEIIIASGEIKGFYNESKLRDIYLQFDDDDYWNQLTANYDTENYVTATLYYKDDTLNKVGVQFKGNTSYTKLGNNAEKMSFSIKTDEFVDDQDIDGYSNLNLNNAFDDNSMMREVIYAHLCREHIPAPQANFINLYINGEYWGPYMNVQQVNKDMLEQWFLSNDGANFRAIGESASTEDGGTENEVGGPDGGGPGGGGPGGGGPDSGVQWGDGTAALNYHDNDSVTYQQYYTLKSSDIDQSWEKLITLCDVLNNTSADVLPQIIEDYLDVDRTLWFLAHEIIYSDDDSYVYKGEMDYYVYYEPETGRMTPLEFDGNSSMSSKNVSWDIFMNEDDENYPLLNKLMAVPALRQRYLAHVRTILNEEMDVDAIHEIIDTYATLIDSSIQVDSKKLMTYNEFLTGVEELKSFVSDRKSFLSSDSEVNVSSLSLSNASYQAYDELSSLPYANDEVNVTVTVADGSAEQVSLYYSTDFVGKLTALTMYDDGNHNDGAANDGVYGVTIPGFDEGSYVRYYFEAIADNGLNTATYLPAGAEHHCYIYRVRYNEMLGSSIVINEIMASNSEMYLDDADEYDDWIELYNVSGSSLSLSGLYLSDNSSDTTKFALPDVTLDADAYLIIWADEDGSQGDNHANFKLDADGEDLFIFDASGDVLEQMSFSNQITDISYARSPNGTGSFAYMYATPRSSNVEEIYSSVYDSELNNVKVYPNPASDILNIIGDNLESFNLEVYSIMGNKVFSEFVTASTYALSCSDWGKGIYCVRINDEVFRVMVE